MRMSNAVVCGMLAVFLGSAVNGMAEEQAAKAQTTCPVMGGKIDKRFYTDYEGKRIYFCCGACPAQFAKDPAKYVKALESSGVVLEKVSDKKDAAK